MGIRRSRWSYHQPGEPHVQCGLPEPVFPEQEGAPNPDGDGEGSRRPRALSRQRIIRKATPHRKCNPNTRVRHWGNRHYHRSKLRKQVLRAIEGFLQPIDNEHAKQPSIYLPFTSSKDLRISITVAYEPRRGTLDSDNFIASLKGAIDGAADAIGVDDRDFRLGEMIQATDANDEGWMLITIERDTP
jgi:hypothetical protein